jgi:hypothetical protein
MISDLAHQYGDVIVIQGDPRVYGRLYVGTNGRGVQVADIHSGSATLPAGWNSQDIGSPATAGSAGESGGTFEVVGGGAGFAGAADQLRFAYQTLAGDGTITARVLGVPNGAPGSYNARAGVMIRDSLASNSAAALVALTPGSVNGVLFQSRATTGASASTLATATTNIFPPYWVRLVRSGDQFTAFASPDGTTWTQVGSPQTIAMGTNVFTGLVSTAGNNQQVNTSTFQNVAIGTNDTTPPAVTGSTFVYQTAPNSVSFIFSEDVSASLSIDDLLVTGPGGNVVPVSLNYNAATNTASFALPTPPTDGNYTATLLAAGVTDAAGNPLPADVNVNFFSLAGDANHDRAVNLLDFNILASNFGQSGRDFSQGDFNYDGSVNLIDFNILAGRFGTSVAPTIARGLFGASAIKARRAAPDTLPE